SILFIVVIPIPMPCVRRRNQDKPTDRASSVRQWESLTGSRSRCQFSGDPAVPAQAYCAFSLAFVSREGAQPTVRAAPFLPRMKSPFAVLHMQKSLAVAKAAHGEPSGDAAEAEGR